MSPNRTFEKAKVAELNVKEFKAALAHAMRSLFGTCGAATEARYSTALAMPLTILVLHQAHILKYDPAKTRAAVCVFTSDASRVRAALTLVGENGGQACRFVVHRESTNLLGLASHSDEYMAQLIATELPDTL